MAHIRPIPAPEEIRRLMHLDWADGAVDGRPPLEDIDRAAHLYGTVSDPYHEIAFGKLRLSHLMLISIYHLMEQHEWSQVWRAIAKLHRMEQDHERKQARPRLAQAPRPESAPPVQAAPTEPAPPEAPPAPPLPSGTFSLKDLLAVCAERGLSLADLEPDADVQPPFT